MRCPDYLSLLIGVPLMNLLNKFLLPAVLLMTSFSTWAAEDGVELLKKNLTERIPTANITRVKETPVDGLYEVVVDSEIYYMNIGARYIINGDLTDLATRTNITEETRSSNRKAIIETFGEENMVVYSPKEVANTITVVTDIDCPYCRRLHSEMDEYMKNNIKVRYIFMPLKGKADFETTVSVWCSENQNEALDIAKSGGKLEKASCDNPIQKHLALARELGVRGTPAIIMENGKMLPGYVPAKKLIPELNKVHAAGT